jgi:FkbM family methyltransferase
MMNPRVGYLVRSLLRPIFGFSHPYRRSMCDVALHFRDLGFQPKTIIDVGVASGTYELYDVWPDAKLILVEAMKDFEPALRHICAHRRAQGSYVVAAAGDRDGEIIMHHSDYLSGASSVIGQQKQQTVPMYTLDTLESRFSGTPPYLLKVDVQGAEASVLAGASKILPLCEVVMLETPLYNFDGNTTTLVELIELMKASGFVPHDIYDGLCRPIDGALGQIDVAFVKVNGPFRQVHSWETAEQSERRNRRARMRNRIGI